MDVNGVSAEQAFCDFEEDGQCLWALDILLAKRGKLTLKFCDI